MKGKEIPVHHQKRLKAIGDFIREYRFNVGLSQQELSEASNNSIHRNTIQAIENQNYPHGYNIISLFEISDALDLDLKDLFWEIE